MLVALITVQLHINFTYMFYNRNFLIHSLSACLAQAARWKGIGERISTSAGGGGGGGDIGRDIARTAYCVTHKTLSSFPERGSSDWQIQYYVPLRELILLDMTQRRLQLRDGFLGTWARSITTCLHMWQ